MIAIILTGSGVTTSVCDTVAVTLADFLPMLDPEGPVDSKVYHLICHIWDIYEVCKRVCV